MQERAKTNFNTHQHANNTSSTKQRAVPGLAGPAGANARVCVPHFAIATVSCASRKERTTPSSSSAARARQSTGRALPLAPARSIRWPSWGNSAHRPCLAQRVRWLTTEAATPMQRGELEALSPSAPSPAGVLRCTRCTGASACNMASCVSLLSPLVWPMATPLPTRARCQVATNHKTKTQK